MHLAIRADGGPGRGYGHLVRTRSLATYARDAGDVVTLATRTVESGRDVYPSDVRVVDVGDDAGRDWLDDVDPDVLLTDSYDVDTDHQSLLRDAVPALCVVTDGTRHVLDCDVAVNGNLYAPSLSYEWRREEPRWCLGPEYLLLRRAVRERAASRSRVDETTRPRRAVVTFGGSDVRHTTPDGVRAFDGSGLNVDVVLGPGVPSDRAETVRTVADRVAADVTVHRSPDDLVELFARADLAVSGCGSTVYELLAIGTPFVAVTMAENQRPIGSALADRDLATVLEMDPSPASIRDAVASLLDDDALRARRSRRGRELIDGRGVERVHRCLQAARPEVGGV